MRYDATVRMYDCLSAVVTVLTVQLTEDGSNERSIVLQHSDSLDGTGENDPLVWARDALLSLLESL